MRTEQYARVFRRVNLAAILVGAVLAMAPLARAALPVIPNAQGWGITTPAGRGGTVYTVTNLNPSGPGSLQEGLVADGPRVIVFQVSGTIVLPDNLYIRHPYLTIAGQTAPSPGITVRGAALVINTHDVLLQHLRLRVGDALIGHACDDRDGIGITVSDQEIYNVVIDHCSVSWAVDGNLDLWYSPLHDVTVRYSIFSEALQDSCHPKGEHSTGLLVGDGAQQVTLFANLFANNADRNPLAKQDTSTEIINNLVYNWTWFGIRTFATSTIIGNHCLPGPNTDPAAKGIYVQYGGEIPSLQPGSVYVANNLGPGHLADSGDDWLAVSGEEQYRADAPVVRSSLAAMAVTEVHDHVLEKAGARPLDRDPVDSRVVRAVLDKTGRIIDSQDEVGGWPTLAENTRILELPDHPSKDDDGDGYTNLEEWLHGYAAELEGGVADDDPIDSAEPTSPADPGAGPTTCPTVQMLLLHDDG